MNGDTCTCIYIHSEKRNSNEQQIPLVNPPILCSMQTNDTLHVVAIAFCAVRQLRTYIHLCFQCFFNVISMAAGFSTHDRDFL